MGTFTRSNYAAPPAVERCRDCGEDLRKPHVLGAHLPGCALAYEAVASWILFDYEPSQEAWTGPPASWLARRALSNER